MLYALLTYLAFAWFLGAFIHAGSGEA